MTSLEGVIFDYGNVLSLPQPQAWVEAMAGVLGVPAQTLHAPYWALRVAYDRADVDGRRYWREVAERCGVMVDDQGVDRLIHLDGESWSVPNMRMVAWADQALRRDVPVALLSNMPAEVRDHIVGHARWLPRFVHATYSCDLRAVKPSPEIYHECVRGLGLDAARVLFIDDRIENVEGARACGLQASHFDDTTRMLLELELAFGVIVD